MSKNRIGFLVSIILLWCFCLYICQDSVSIFISDWHDLKQNAPAIPHADSFHRTESPASAKRHLITTALMNFGLLTMVTLLTISYFKALKKKDSPQSENAWLVSKSRKRLLVYVAVLCWCLFLHFCWTSVHVVPSAWHRLNQPPLEGITISPSDSKQIAEDIASGNKVIASLNKEEHKINLTVLITMVFGNLACLYLAIMSTKMVFKNNNINNHGNPAIQS